uniref:F-box domain-containing protein n=1 Tax=Solanum tuberosum TaxID=4113 RepID=A4UV26_SOLTU|nr:F-box domain-containing protein [Solanum tuberosum]
MSSSSRSGTLLCVFLLLGCIGIATATATEPKTESFGTSSIRLWHRGGVLAQKYHHHQLMLLHLHHRLIIWLHQRIWLHPQLMMWFSPPHTAPTTSCIKVDGCALDLITSVFKRRISLSTQCCQGLSTISDDCFYRGYTHSKRVPIFLGKVRNYCSHAVDNAASPTHASPSPSLVDNSASPTHAAPSPSPVDDVVSPSPSPSPVDDVVSPSHMAPSWGPATAPTTSCIKVNGCAFNLITYIFKRKI